MCYYEVPVSLWLPCGHVRSFAAVRRYCNFQQDLSVPPSSRPPLPEACRSPVYFENRLFSQALCPSCAWKDYYRRLEEATALYGPQVSSLVLRPPYLIPWYSSTLPVHSGFLGVAPTPREFEGEGRKARVAEWVSLQTRYRYEGVQESSLCAMEGASIENLPPGWMERMGSRSMVPQRLPADQGVRARIESKQ